MTFFIDDIIDIRFICRFQIKHNGFSSPIFLSYTTPQRYFFPQRMLYSHKRKEPPLGSSIWNELFKVNVALIFLFEKLKYLVKSIFIVNADIFLCIFVNLINLKNNNLVCIFVIFDENNVLCTLKLNYIKKFKFNFLTVSSSRVMSIPWSSSFIISFFVSAIAYSFPNAFNAS